MSEIIFTKQSDIPSIREKLYSEQNGICPICKKELNKPCVDHSHQKKNKGTGLIRGLICSGCNILLGKLENNSPRYGIPLSELSLVLRNMADYLESPHTNMMHYTETPKEPKLQKSLYNKLKKAYILSEKKAKFPEYPKSGKMTAGIKKLLEEFNLLGEIK